MNSKAVLVILSAALLLSAIYVHRQWDEWFVLPTLRQPVVRTLKDPGSVQFRNETRNGNTLCGEINAKNSLGGYVGFKRFLVAGTEVTIEDHGLVTQSSDDRSTKAIIADLDLRIALMRSLKREPSAKELADAIFERSWKRHCSAS